jgi:hypothetical protein
LAADARESFTGRFAKNSRRVLEDRQVVGSYFRKLAAES